MYLKKTYKKESGRTYLAIAQKYRHPKKNVSTDRTIKSLGYLDEEPFSYNTNSIMILLVISRLLSPGSKKKAFEERGRYFERFHFSLADMYRALSHYGKLTKDFQRYLNLKIGDKYGRDTSTIYYDVTNFYFEIDKADDLRKYGRSSQSCGSDGSCHGRRRYSHTLQAFSGK